MRTANVLLSLILLLSGISFSADTLRIYWADVEGGAATLLVTPAGESVLIDTGSAGGRDAKRIFEIASQQAHLKQIDYLVTTHFHSDHFGGAAELAGMIPIKTVYDNGIFEGGYERPTKAYDLFPAEKRAVLNPGDEISLASTPGQPPLKLRCICARQKFIDPPKDAPPAGNCDNPARKPSDKSDNANSIALLLSCGDFRFFAAGDLTWNVEEKLVCPVNLVGTVDVYQVTHHGLEQSNNPLIVSALTPAVAVMSNGCTKGSEPGTWKALRATPSIQAVFQIHKNLRPDSTNNTSDDLIANLEKNCEGNFITLELDGPAKNYTVSIPAKKVSKTFAVKTK